MNTKKIISMARKSGLAPDVFTSESAIETFEKFAALILEHERETSVLTAYKKGYEQGKTDAIRARGEK
jgi:hypothetical protein